MTEYIDVNQRLAALLFIFITGASTAAVVLSCSTAQHADVRIIMGTGGATIYNERTDRARERAVDDALHSLVHASYHDGKGRSFYGTLEPFIDIRTSGIVTNWKILRQKEEDGTYYVQLRGAVNLSIRDTVTGNCLQKYSPTVLLLVHEVEGDEDRSAEKTVSYPVMTASIRSNDFDVIDYSAALSKTENAKSLFESSMGTTVLTQNRTEFMDRIGADVLVIGTVTISDQTGLLEEYDTPMQSRRAVVNLRSVDVYTGKILASVSENAAGVHADSTMASHRGVENCIGTSSVFGTDDARKGVFLQQTLTEYLHLLSSREYTIIIQNGKEGSAETLLDDLIGSTNRVVSAQPMKEVDGNPAVRIVFSGTTDDLAGIFTSSDTGLTTRYTVDETSPGTVSVSVKQQPTS